MSRAAGFENLPAGPSVDEVAEEMAAFRVRIEKVPPHERRPEAFSFRFATLDAPAKLDALLSEATAWQPELIVHETADLAAPPVAAALGVPSAQHSFGRLLPHACLERAAPLTAQLWERLGLDARPVERRVPRAVHRYLPTLLPGCVAARGHTRLAHPTGNTRPPQIPSGATGSAAIARLST